MTGRSPASASWGSAATSRWRASWATSATAWGRTPRSTSTRSRRHARRTHSSCSASPATTRTGRCSTSSGRTVPHIALGVAVSDHVTMLPRGHRWELGGRSFVALGSAPSVNRDLLTEGVSWWPTEVMLEEHVEATVAGGLRRRHAHPRQPGTTVVHRARRRRHPGQPMGLAGLDPRLRAGGHRPGDAGGGRCRSAAPGPWSLPRRRGSGRPATRCRARHDDLVARREPGSWRTCGCSTWRR